MKIVVADLSISRAGRFPQRGFGLAINASKITLILRIAPKELPGKPGKIKIVEVSIGGRRSPIGYRLFL